MVFGANVEVLVRVDGLPVYCDVGAAIFHEVGPAKFHRFHEVIAKQITRVEFSTNINQSITQISIAPISLARPYSVVGQPNQSSIAKSVRQPVTLTAIGHAGVYVVHSHISTGCYLCWILYLVGFDML